MNIRPTGTSKPQYPVLTTIAVAATLASCEQVQPQRTAGVPLPPPTTGMKTEAQLGSKDTAPQRTPQRLPGAKKVER